ncbi:MAG: 6-pyruvoyl trahydropterin synthase family protein [Bacteroidota bacterium]|jgi:6-pyruvoyltetrahydropterin/6-carboxytetrahydropterin synthase|uniref:6-pyruvoyl trahydropterin synthase family protein n=1 Tax=Candidatus Pollutiaquabacter sp. TaxID=3416354 RepID=UPI001A4C7E44|nr:6-carboxytetrahydropterin synthase [Bacteroidota bacterium]MBL7948268.1 6-carboxytetrahydropterin synthase [Bacteroidia bacterium]MBP6009834.1 6-carboxytetrahydropterin synthase [Bacteroidia bacterium]MBP7269270.1 6-carboxytetrahydropterin synthase [Bacteroidia bacterium]MBP7436116.1 6-carboxytetrahydropterin synthase [Bacteroidia bacterium]
MFVRLTRKFPFEMAHALYGYDGPCKNIHGHSYRLEVTVLGKALQESGHPKDGMLMDFGDLKKIVNEAVVNQFDHALVLNGQSPHKDLDRMRDNFEKIIYVDYQPTCENLLLDFRERIAAKLPNSVRMVSMRLHETANAFAEWNETDQPR